MAAARSKLFISGDRLDTLADALAAGRAFAGLAKYAYVLEHARVAIEGPPEQLAGDDRVRKAYLGL